MSRKKRNITVLTVGDRIDFDSYKKSDHERASFLECGFDYASTHYAQVLEGKIPRVKTEKVVIFLFFPFLYWNRHIEHKRYRDIYGNRAFYEKFSHFWDMVEKKLKKRLSGKKILFINDPKVCSICRDKLSVIRKLAASGIPQPKLHNISTVKGMRRKLDSGYSFFIKPQCGSMGKGITFLSKFDWQTNFKFRNNRIVSRRSDYGWKFRNVTGNYEFLKVLLKKDVLVQEAIDSPILGGNRVDLRMYTFLGRAMYIYPRKNTPENVTTNISQGGRGDPRLLKALPEELINKAKREAVRVSRALGINLGGIDIVPDHNLKKVYVVDVNVFSGFPKLRTFNLTRHIAEELKRLDKEGELVFT